jgi:hydrogenase nickel incorporation protein HypA/HybF
MHEWALADAVVAAAAKAAEGKAGARLPPVTVLIGELQAINREIFAFALRTLSGESSQPPRDFLLETEPAAFRCRACATAWGLGGDAGLTEEEREAIHFLPESAHAFLRCPSCGSVDFAVESGRGVRLAETGR